MKRREMIKRIKGVTAILLAASMMLGGCTSTGNTGKTVEEDTTQQAEPVDVNVMALNGPTAMGMVKFMTDSEAGVITENNYQFEVASSIDEVTPKIVKGEVDIAAVPANVASVLYNNTEQNVEVLAINTLGVLYICETGDSIQSVADLKGKTIYASGKGATPEYALNYILEENGMTPGKDVTIEWKSEHAECVAALTSDPNGIAMLPQPFVTTAQTKNSAIRVALDLTEEWDSLQNSETKSSMVTGVVVAGKEFVEENPEAVEDFLNHYEESVNYINENVKEGAALVGNYNIVPEAVAEKAIPECNIVFISGNEMKEKLSGYLTVLNDQNPKAIGGTLPGDDFYYGAE